MTTPNAVTQPTETQMIQYLRNSDLDLFYIAPKQHSSQAARNTTSQLTDAELQAVESGKGRVGLRLDTPNYKMVEIFHDPFDTESLNSIALLPEPAITIWDGEYQCISNLYFVDAPMPNLRISDTYGLAWLEVKGGYNNPSAHSLLSSSANRRTLLDLHPRLHTHNSFVPTKDLEWRLRCATATEAYSCLINCGKDTFYLMQYLAVNGVAFSTAMTMMNTILRRYWPTQLKESDVGPIYMDSQRTMTKAFAYDGLKIRFPNGDVAGLLDRCLGFTAPELAPEV
jgi:hypothetical protein